MIADRHTAAKYAETHLCPNCGQSAVLVVRWSAAASNYEVYCAICKATEGFLKPKSLTAMWRADPGSVPITVANRMANKHRKSIESEIEGLPDDLAATIREKYLG